MGNDDLFAGLAQVDEILSHVEAAEAPAARTAETVDAIMVLVRVARARLLALRTSPGGPECPNA